MRVEQYKDGDPESVLVILSERNVYSLLAKLFIKDSARTIEAGDTIFTPLVGALAVSIERDENHYGEREFPPGPVTSETQTIADYLRKVVEAYMNDNPFT